jgi:peptidyl-prolyl cis-trans isomerase A (cyclophilin A)
MKRIISFLIIGSLFFTSCKDKYKDVKDGLYAEIETPKGSILIQLEYQKAPITVANFVTLIEGTNPYVKPEYKEKPFYDKLLFHRVEPGFVIQGGDPLGNGSGDAGYSFKDEFTDLKHDKAGTLSMANSGPNTNSSQFFITLNATPHLDGRHSVFGYVVDKDLETIQKITLNDEISSIKIIRKGEAAKKFDAVKIFSNYFKEELENQKKQKQIDAENEKKYKEQYQKTIADKIIYFQKMKAKANKSTSGLKYVFVNKDAAAEKPEEGSQILVNYAGFLEDGTLFDTSYPNVAKQFGKFDENRAAQNGYMPLPIVAGQKGGAIPGFEEGLAKMNKGDKIILFIPPQLGYGENGAGNVIPPNANLIFEVEIVK